MIYGWQHLRDYQAETQGRGGDAPKSGSGFGSKIPVGM